MLSTLCKVKLKPVKHLHLIKGSTVYSLRALHAQATFYMNSLQGLGRSMPFTSAAFVIGGLSLIGVPGTAGFISKWLLLEAALESGYWLVAILIIVSSLFAVIYIWKIIEVLYFSEGSKSYSEVSVLTLTPIWILALFCIFLGVNTSLTVNVANMAAEILFK